MVEHKEFDPSDAEVEAAIIQALDWSRETAPQEGRWPDDFDDDEREAMVEFMKVALRAAARVRENTSALLLAVADVRQVTGVGGKPMLSELGESVRAVLWAKDERILALENGLHEIAGSALSGSFFEEIALETLGSDTERDRADARIRKEQGNG